MRVASVKLWIGSWETFTLVRACARCRADDGCYFSVVPGSALRESW